MKLVVSSKLVYMESMFFGWMGPRASKNAFTMYTAIAGGEKNVHFGPTLARFCMVEAAVGSLRFGVLFVAAR